jgi:predicted phosphodiesterase
MRVAVVTDIHGNRQALEAVLADAGAANVDEVWCLGDVVGYGGDPDACVELIRDHASVCLAGNHDLGVIGSIPLEDFSDVARRAAEWTRTKISAEAHAYLESLVPSDEERVVSLFHGSPRDPVWEYVLSPLQADLGFDAQRHPVCLVGHTHVALYYHRPPLGETSGQTQHSGDQLDLSSGYWLVNPGSVGQPRDGDPRAAWLELDTDLWTAVYRRTEYDIDSAAWAIRAARLPHSLADRLSHGQ